MTASAVAIQHTPSSTSAEDAGGATRAWARALKLTGELAAEPGLTLAALLDRLAERHGDAPALVSEGGGYSFAGLAARARRYTRWAQARGYGPGRVVALLAANQPDYFACWVGVSRTGASVALLNTQLRGGALAHCLEVAGADVLLVSAALEEAGREAAALLSSSPAVEPFAPDLAAFSDAPLPQEEGGGAIGTDRALLIYTSGTTGLPKAANVSHARVLTWCGWFAGMMDAGPADRLYNCLPMYHSIGGVVAVGGALLQGGSVFLRERFSASQFWEEVVRHRCTLFQYIGELCRFLLAAPPHPLERAHGLRLACGNGLQEAVWGAFQERFAIPRVLEFYAATEGSFSLYNVEGRRGSIGRPPPFLAHRFPAAIVRRDAAFDAPARDGEGRCIRCEPDEVGEAIGRIAGAGEGPNRFEGYTSARESEAKVLRNVFKPGDAWFRTGDLMRRDAQGFFYFVDRAGDTFRWKGENVSTAEVAAVLAGCPGVVAAAVYGVAIPGCEGRGGMAALEVAEGFSLDALAELTAGSLPAYARPVFLRQVEALAVTGTFKPQKAGLQEAGFDPQRGAGEVFILEGGAYRPLDPQGFAAITAGERRL